MKKEKNRSSFFHVQNTANFHESSRALPSNRVFSALHVKDFPWSPTRGVNFSTDVEIFPVGDTCSFKRWKKEQNTVSKVKSVSQYIFLPKLYKFKLYFHYIIKKNFVEKSALPK